MRCSKEDGVRDYFDVGVIGYSGHQHAPLWRRLAGRLFGYQRHSRQPLTR